MLTNHTYLMFHQKNGKMVCSFFTFQMFCSSHFLFLDSFGDEVTKIRKCYVIFVCILQGKTGKTQNENHATKVTKIPKTIRRKYGMNETHVYSKNQKTIHKGFYPILQLASRQERSWSDIIDILCENNKVNFDLTLFAQAIKRPT